MFKLHKLVVTFCIPTVQLFFASKGYSASKNKISCLDSQGLSLVLPAKELPAKLSKGKVSEEPSLSVPEISGLSTISALECPLPEISEPSVNQSGSDIISNPTTEKNTSVVQRTDYVSVSDAVQAPEQPVLKHSIGLSS